MKQLLIILLTVLITGTVLTAQEQTTSSFTGWLITNYRNDFRKTGVNSFGFRNIRLIYKGGYNQKLSYFMVADMVGTRDKKPMFLQGWLDYALNDNFSVRMGQYKYPFGMEAYPSVMTWKFVNVSLGTSAIVSKLGRAGGSYRDIGLQLSGHFPLSESLALRTKMMIMNGNGINTADDGSAKDYVFRASLETTEGITAGFSYFQGVNQQQIQDLGETAWDVFVSVRKEQYTAQAEYISASYQQAGMADITPAGFYIYGTYMFLPGWEGGIRYDTYNANRHLAVQNESRISLGLAYYLNTLNRIALNYEFSTKNSPDLLTIQFYGTID